jgi:hypothetical protein
VDSILRYRIPSETPFLTEQVDWTWKVVGSLPDGSYLVRVDLVEKQRMQRYLDECAIDPGIQGVLVEDELLTLWQSQGRTGAGASGPSLGRTSAQGETSADGGTWTQGGTSADGGTQAQSGVSPQTDERVTPAEQEQIHLYRLRNRLLAVLVLDGQCARSNVLSINHTNPTESAVTHLIEGLLTDVGGQDAGSVQGIGERRVRRQRGLEPCLPSSGVSETPDLENPLEEPADALAGDETRGHAAAVPARDAMELLPLKAGGWILFPKSVRNRKLGSCISSESRRDLLPESWRARASGRRTVLGLLATGVLGLAVALLFSLVTGQVEKHVRETRLGLDAERAVLKTDLEEVQAAQLLIEHVGAWSGTGRVILSAWDRISAGVPKGVILTGLAIRDDGALTIHGAAPDRPTIIALMEALRSDHSGLFSKVLLGGLEERGGKQVFHLLGHVPTQKGPRSP